MARNLRSSSHAMSNDSRPSTPAPHMASTASPFPESTRPRKQRRTGTTSRVATDPPQDIPVSSQSQPDQPEETPTNGVNGTQLVGQDSEWNEPELKAPAPSYSDTPWSAVSSDANPVLSTMRPLGTMPSAADLRKAGLVPSKPSTPSIPARKEPHHAPNGEKSLDKPLTPLTPAEEQPPELIPLMSTLEDNLAEFTILPLPSSTDADVEKLKAAVENALRLASEADNRPVIRGLIRMWEKCGNDPYALTILDDVCQETPAPRQRSVFQDVMRSAWKELQSEGITINEPTILPAPGRARSASSDSTLSTAKSLDAETYAPVVVATSAARSRKAKQSKNATQKKNDPGHRSAFPSSDLQRKGTGESPEPSTEAVQTKRTRLQRSFPKIVASESGLRSSLSSNPSSNPSSPGPIVTIANLSTTGVSAPLRARSESLASSDAGDNRRLTPSLTDNERTENNDYCQKCERSGQLLCCDGCVHSYHFSCLNPPLDPANPPDGDWFCSRCSVSQSITTLLGGLENVPGKDFALPARIRDFFAGIRTSEDGRYDEVASLPRFNPRAARGSRSGRYDDPFLLRTIDAKGNLIVCVKCGRTTNGRRPIIQCDYCPCAFHMDCVDTPLAVPPTQRPGSDRLHHTWMCPNHALHDMYYIVEDEEGHEAIKRIRRPKNPRYVDIEVLPEEDEEEILEEQEEEGVTYRVSEKGVKLDFIERVKRENENAATKKAAADRYFEYAKAKFDDLMSKAHAFYASQKPTIIAEEETTAAIMNSRTVAEREAAANLITFAQSHQQLTCQEDDHSRIGLLIDQLKANAPNDLPPPEDEITSLRTLQKLIEQRIEVLNLQSGNFQSPKVQPNSAEKRAASTH
ncbi:hypothetical protein BDW59DRAFT_37321 [Aspergillus cavernicola]|uniref:PHD-type domain-containing protein n=1 Tax=Aspergillus cavernicola TaxID=176166 RepID=A0ABR4IN10_9EURO